MPAPGGVNSRACCPHGDPQCPCQDGDMCHYEGPNPFPEPSPAQKREWRRLHEAGGMAVVLEG